MTDQITPATDATVDFSGKIREVTEEEVAAYRRDGWVLLRGFFSPDVTEELLRRMQRTIDDRLEDRDPYVEERTANTTTTFGKREVAETNLRESDPWVDRLARSREVGEAGAALLGRRPLRIFQDAVFRKPPVSQIKDSITGRGNTPWHQDFPSMPMDRACGVQFWVAANEVTPDMGILRYLSGSHRGLPPLGKVRAFRDADGNIPEDGAMAVYPELLGQFEISEPMHLQPGDCFAHDTMTMHCAENNTSDRVRWAWAVHLFGADVGYNGAPNIRTDDRGLVLNDVFDSPAFPLVALPDQP